ncbi:CLUMA_CG000388, isoform A [Clunio marinus]|uniref:CLUMA_CG000388, isoform A n=1 Tax=Clunio marinus TaxID=568069 RepID=A0A1J1HER1_9DIPT|nr:CLUMA_CG000388, isoform A [Clunio marinus]
MTRLLKFNQSFDISTKGLSFVHKTTHGIKTYLLRQGFLFSNSPSINVEQFFSLLCVFALAMKKIDLCGTTDLKFPFPEALEK